MPSQTDHSAQENKPIKTSYERSRSLKIYWITFLVMGSFIKFKILSQILGDKWRNKHLTLVIVKNARRVKEAIIEAKGLFIKVGQLISMMGSFLPAEFRQELESLQDHIPASSPSQIRQRITSELGAPPEELFEYFNPQPIASASLAQVHEATLKSGENIALKVQHIDIEHTAQQDLKTFKRILTLINIVMGVRGLLSYHSQIHAMILEELDFTQEATNLKKISKNFQGNKEVKFPKTYDKYCTKHIIATEFINGVKPTNIRALEKFGIDKETLARKILTAYCEMFIKHGLYHADPHPGNFLIQQDGTPVFIDFGAVASLSPSMKEGIPMLLNAEIQQDNKKLISILRSMGFITPFGEDETLLKLIELYQQRLHTRSHLEDLTLEHIMNEMSGDWTSIFDFTKLGISTGELISSFQVPMDWVLLHRTLALLVGLATDLAPDLHPAPIIKPYLKALAADTRSEWGKLLTDSVIDTATAIALTPKELHTVLKSANQGDLQLQIFGWKESINLIYCLGQQLMYSIFTLASGGGFFWARWAKDSEMEGYTLGVFVFFLWLTLRAIRQGRDLQRKISYRR
ncbi:MAG: AarF/ABC1/UbiB kinase family protein [Pseudomonadales bacterium]|nr:AarF/ABC1/UbiB kinase family protein [Pseudomonadales bacterium]